MPQSLRGSPSVWGHVHGKLEIGASLVVYPLVTPVRRHREYRTLNFAKSQEGSLLGFIHVMENSLWNRESPSAPWR